MVYMKDWASVLVSCRKPLWSVSTGNLWPCWGFAFLSPWCLPSLWAAQLERVSLKSWEKKSGNCTKLWMKLEKARHQARGSTLSWKSLECQTQSYKVSWVYGSPHVHSNDGFSLVVIFSSTVRTFDNCPAGFVYIKETRGCYRLIYDTETWSDAYAACRDLDVGAGLVTFNTATEEYFVHDLIHTYSACE